MWKWSICLHLLLEALWYTKKPQGTTTPWSRQEHLTTWLLAALSLAASTSPITALLYDAFCTCNQSNSAYLGLQLRSSLRSEFTPLSKWPMNSKWHQQLEEGPVPDSHHSAQVVISTDYLLVFGVAAGDILQQASVFSSLHSSCSI